MLNTVTETEDQVIVEFEMLPDHIEYLESESKKRDITISELVEHILWAYMLKDHDKGHKCKGNCKGQ